MSEFGMSESLVGARAGFPGEGTPPGARASSLVPGTPGAGVAAPPNAPVEDLLRELAPQVLGVLVRRYGQFEACEDAVQEALLAAASRWPGEGRPENPRAWLVTVAARRLVDQVRAEQARRHREERAALATPQAELVGPAADARPDADRDDSLTLFFLCCHPALSGPSRVALTLRAVGGLTTAQIAAAFLVPEATMAQRISRAKQSIRAAGATFRMPEGEERSERLAAVLHVLYLVFNEGYTATDGAELTVPMLSEEAIRLVRMLHRLLPDDGEVAGLLALMLLTDARRPARTGPGGDLVPLDEQDRGRWDRGLIEEGVGLLGRFLPRGKVGPYQLQAAIAAVHAEAGRADDTDWPQILALYDLLEQVEPSPVVALNRAVAVAMVHGPAVALDLLAELEADRRMARHHRLHAARAHFLEMAGEYERAADAYREAARRAMSVPERRYLTGRVVRLGEG
ncbi:sigma-70 family RNA polymerase sigma factor [Streptomyces sp. NPDC003077]|uniref:RNA polymerase sigma factor n=1 Tax=Streptomyces sp. NPDC003077 TaxID=3154443 RepID=UPI0033BB37CF